MDRISQRFLKHIEGTQGLYEIRISKGNNSYRIFSCFDEGKLVILFQGFQKKSRKTPKREIINALRLKEEYFKKKGLNDEKY